MGHVRPSCLTGWLRELEQVLIPVGIANDVLLLAEANEAFKRAGAWLDHKLHRNVGQF